MNSVFFGGGTPSLMQPDVVANVIAEIRKLWPVANDLEVTLEANPGSVEAGRFAAYADGGVNRISMGIQALNDADLKRLGRLHTAKEAIDAFNVARSQFDRVSFDLIYARQDQSLSDWEHELKHALTLAVDHLSLYQLTIEDGTAFGARHSSGKLKGLPSGDLGADLFDLTQDLCGAAGLDAYEVSNHARDGAQSRHNLIYWRYGDYVGIGPGAHGRVTTTEGRWATEAVRNPTLWLRGAGREKAWDPLSRADQATEYLLMGMRLKEGIDLNRFERLAGHSLDHSKIKYLEDIGMAETGPGRLTVTERGFKVLNAVLAEIA